ncbi:MAG: autotransporter domain-containing protein [Reyranellaceae bacterium]
MLRKIAIAAGLLAAGLVQGAAFAQPTGWNYYNGYTSLPTIPFASGAMSSTNGASVFLQMNGGSPTPFTMDTGSTGIVVSPDYFRPGPNDINQGPGSVTYTSSGITYKGTYYQTNVSILQTNQGANNSTTAGAQLATSTVTVLAASQICGADGHCGPTTPIAYMGIGYDRDQMSTIAPVGSKINAFTNITSLASGASLDSYRQGYIITNTGITLGLSTAATQNFGVIKLTPDTSKSFPTAGVPWSTAPMTVVVNNGSNPSSGTLLPDTGINYMFLTTASNNRPTTTSCDTSSQARNCAVNGTQFQVWLPGQTGSAATFSYVVAKDQAGQPGRVEYNSDNTANTGFVNTGREFYQNFSYFYDDVGGYVGYTTVPGGTWAMTAVSPLLALTGTVPLIAGFQEWMPVFLYGDTLLQTSGSAAFNGAITGANNNLSLSGGGAFAFSAPVALGTGSFNVQQGAASITAGLSATTITVSSQGALNNNPGSTITGTVSNAGAFDNSGTVVGNLTNAGTLAGSGTFVGNVVNAGAIRPGNGIGTMTIAGSYTNTPSGAFVAEVGNAGQSSRINVTGTAILQGGTVAVTPIAGVFAPRTTYTIVSSTGGLSGSFGSVSSGGSSFLQPSLAYDANNAYLTMTIGGFAAAAQTPTQYAVGAALDASAPSASGDFANILGTIAGLNSSTVMPFLTSISGQNYSAFSNSMVQGAQLFMNNFALQVGGGSVGPRGGRVALAQACEVACQTFAPPTWGAWGGALGGTGTVGTGAVTGSTTYNVGGFAAGLDRQITPSFLAGVTVGYTTGTQWVSGFSGQSSSNTVQVGLYGSFFQDAFYLDGMVSYANSTNQMWRNIAIPNLQQRTAQGLTGANQFFGQLEGGYRFTLSGPAMAFITPFARLQGYTGTQNAFTETGAQSLSLSVAAQTTNSLRSVIGAQLGGSMDFGWRDRLYAQLRLGWSHEYADVTRPVTASLAGAPSFLFTTYGATPTRDGAVVGVQATTSIAEAASIYLRYEGNIAGQDTTHALTAGLRMTW